MLDGFVESCEVNSVVKFYFVVFFVVSVSFKEC